jgi:hypothetical protein
MLPKEASGASEAVDGGRAVCGAGSGILGGCERRPLTGGRIRGRGRPPLVQCGPELPVAPAATPRTRAFPKTQIHWTPVIRAIGTTSSVIV